MSRVFLEYYGNVMKLSQLIPGGTFLWATSCRLAKVAGKSEPVVFTNNIELGNQECRKGTGFKSGEHARPRVSISAPRRDVS